MFILRTSIVVCLLVALVVVGYSDCSSSSDGGMTDLKKGKAEYAERQAAKKTESEQAKPAPQPSAAAAPDSQKDSGSDEKLISSEERETRTHIEAISENAEFVDTRFGRLKTIRPDLEDDKNLAYLSLNDSVFHRSEFTDAGHTLYYLFRFDEADMVMFFASPAFVVG